MRISDWSSDVCSSDLPSIGIDHGADPGRGRPDDRQPFLDCPQPRLRQMLRRPPRAEPGVVGGVEEEIGPVRAVDDLARKDDLVADQSGRAAVREKGWKNW